LKFENIGYIPMHSRTSRLLQTVESVVLDPPTLLLHSFWLPSEELVEWQRPIPAGKNAGTSSWRIEVAASKPLGLIYFLQLKTFESGEFN
jgi:hypothetical protein